jgi:predicted lysophospholipase L1 biosynthesis ABC-type transport system permease subunit
MEDIKEHLKDIQEIRAMMERNSKFLSLSGLSGVSAGIVALAGAFAAWWYLGKTARYEPLGLGAHPGSPYTIYAFFALDAGLVMLFAVGLAAFFSRRMALKKGLPLWTPTSKLLLLNLLIPLAAGGAFCLVLLMHGSIEFIPACMLLFYGMALLNASKFTLPEIRWLGISELILGLACAVWYMHSIYFWALGFGVAHIIYGAVMYYKYER